jgi:hypothetical protein
VVPNGQPYTIGFSTDPVAIAAGGPTFLEYRTTKLGAGAFTAFTEVSYRATLHRASLYEPRDVLVTVCDEKDNYRFAFNGQEKVNEINGIGNHNTALFWEYDTRLGRRWNLDPVDQISISNYAVFNNSPIMYNDVLGDAPGASAIAIPLTPKVRVPRAGNIPQARGAGLGLDLYIWAGDKMIEHEEQMQQEAATGAVLSSVIVGGILQGKIGDIAEKVDEVAQKTKTLVTDAVNKVANVILKAHGAKNQSTGSFTKGGAKATKHQKGETHGSLSSKKGNKPNPNKRRGSENRGGKKE